MSVLYKIYPPLFGEIVRPFPADPTYFRSDGQFKFNKKSRDGLTQRQLCKRHDYLSDKQGVRLSYTFNVWLDMVDESRYLTETDKHRLYACTYRYGSRKTSGFICKMRDICPWCRAHLIVNAVKHLSRLPEDVGLTKRFGGVEEKKRVFRPPSRTLMAMRSVVHMDDEFKVTAVFLRQGFDWTGKRGKPDLIRWMLQFEPEMVMSPLLPEYRRHLRHVKMLTVST